MSAGLYAPQGHDSANSLPTQGHPWEEISRNSSKHQYRKLLRDSKQIRLNNTYSIMQLIEGAMGPGEIEACARKLDQISIFLAIQNWKEI